MSIFDPELGDPLVPGLPERITVGRPRGPRIAQARAGRIAGADRSLPIARTVRILDCAVIPANGTIPVQAIDVGRGSTLRIKLVVVNSSGSIGFRVVVQGGNGDGNWSTVTTLTVTMGAPGYYESSPITNFSFDFAQFLFVDLSNATQILADGEAVITGNPLAAGAVAAPTSTGDSLPLVTDLAIPDQADVDRARATYQAAEAGLSLRSEENVRASLAVLNQNAVDFLGWLARGPIGAWPPAPPPLRRSHPRNCGPGLLPVDESKSRAHDDAAEVPT